MQLRVFATLSYLDIKHHFSVDTGQAFNHRTGSTYKYNNENYVCLHLSLYVHIIKTS